MIRWLARRFQRASRGRFVAGFEIHVTAGQPSHYNSGLDAIVKSVTGVPVRLTDERWAHITEEHCELAGLRLELLETIARPQRVVAENAGECLALREVEDGKWLVAVYRGTMMGL